MGEPFEEEELDAWRSKTNWRNELFTNKTMKHKGTINLDGKTYEVEVKDGVRYIEGKTVDEFIETLTKDQLDRSAAMGLMAIKHEIAGKPISKGKLQYYLNEDLDTTLDAFDKI